MKLLFSLLLSIPRALVGGFVFSHMWNWFIVRRFNAQPLSVLDAIGLTIVLTYPLTGLHVANVIKDMKADKKYDLTSEGWSIVTSMLMIVVIYPMMLAISYVWHLVIG